MFNPVCCVDTYWSRFDIRSLAESTEKCIDFKRRVCLWTGPVIFLWSSSRCIGSKARRARKSYACLRWSSVDRIPARCGRYSVGVGRAGIRTQALPPLLVPENGWLGNSRISLLRRDSRRCWKVRKPSKVAIRYISVTMKDSGVCIQVHH